MTIAYWCVVTVVFMPYIWVLTARVPTFSLQGNLEPRLASDELTGYQQRFYWAHLNALEAIAPFAAVVFIAQQLHADQATIDMLAMSFVGLRLAHAMAYAANLGLIRSIAFFGASVCMVFIVISAV